MTNSKVLKLSQLNLSRRVYKALWRSGINSIEMLATLSDEQLLSIRGFSEIELAEVHEKLSVYISLHSHFNKRQSKVGGKWNLSYKKEEALQQPTKSSIKEILATLPVQNSLELLELSTRSYNALRRSGIDTIEHLALMGEEELLEVKNLGTESLKSIQNILRVYLEHHPLSEEYAELVNQYRLSQTRQLPFTTLGDSSLPIHSNFLIEPELLDRASCLPLDRISITRLALSEHLYRELLSHQVKSVGDLIQQTADKFKDVNPIRERIQWYIDWLLTQAETVREEEVEGHDLSPVHKVALEETPLDTFVANWFTALSDREQQTIYGRYGLLGDTLTLEQLGERFGVTRERVRQIQKHAKGKLKKVVNFQKIKPLTELLYYVLAKSGGLMTAQQLRERLCKILVVGQIDPLSVADLVFELDDIGEHFRGLYGWEDKELPLTKITEVQRQLSILLDEGKVPLTTSQLIAKFKDTEFYQEYSDELDDVTIDACLRSHPRLRVNGGIWYLKKQGWLRLAGIILALREIGEPAHYELITKNTNAILPSNLHRTPHNIHAELGRRPDIFVRVGHGIFGLAEWGLTDDGSVANAIYRVLLKAGKPLHCEVITEHVLETWRVNPGSVQAALYTDDRFVNIGNSVYWVRDHELPETALDFGDLFGAKLARQQKEIERWDNGIEHDTYNEVDLIRDIGTDFFGG